MKPSKYHALMRAVDDVLEPTEEEWDKIDERVEKIRSRQ